MPPRSYPWEGVLKYPKTVGIVYAIRTFDRRKLILSVREIKYYMIKCFFFQGLSPLLKRKGEVICNSLLKRLENDDGRCKLLLLRLTGKVTLEIVSAGGGWKG